MKIIITITATFDSGDGPEEHQDQYEVQGIASAIALLVGWAMDGRAFDTITLETKT